MTEEEIFVEAISLKSPDERSRFLDNACNGNPALRLQIDDLLKAHDSADSILDGNIHCLESTVRQIPATERPGTTVGQYKLLQEIGEGGFGIVFMAQQVKPIRRKVALKVIKPGMDTREVISRFEAEEQALAMMNHVNIAQVFDAGTTESGRPYFAMELVPGIPITEYCRENNLSITEILRLFIDVCNAVHHAHQKGIIHRDIKPSNVLVTLHDGAPVVKVIDFGVAKAINRELTERTLFTRFCQMVGTPLYMSPEQAQMNGLDVDIRSDIYSLGVLLYELLTGTTPIEKKRLHEAGYEEIRRIIREEDPPRPSTRISTLRNAQKTVCEKRTVEVNRLSAMVRGELDWIVIKALEKQRSRRYETARDFAADIERHLRNDPVEACPPSMVYHVRKLYRRNRAVFIVAQLVAVILILTAILSSLSATEAASQARLAKTAQQQAQDSEEELLSYVEKLADSYAKQHRYEDSEQLYRKVIDVRSQRSGKKCTQVLTLKTRLAHVLTSLDRLNEAIALHEAVLTDQSDMLGPNHADVRSTIRSLAEVHMRQVVTITCESKVAPDKLDQALVHAQRAVALVPSSASWWCLAWCHYLAGESQESRQCLDKSMGMLEIEESYPMHTLLCALLTGQEGEKSRGREWLFVSCEMLGQFPDPNTRDDFPVQKNRLPYTLASAASVSLYR